MSGERFRIERLRQVAQTFRDQIEKLGDIENNPLDKMVATVIENYLSERFKINTYRLRSGTQLSRNNGTSLGRLLERARSDARLSQPEVARLLRVHPNTIINWELDNFEISAEKLWAISRLYNVPIQAFFPKLTDGRTK